MGETELLPLKRVELSLTKFNEVAIPHHLELLRQHKANMLKYESLGQYSRVVSEQRHSGRVVSQLRGLLRDLADLRQRVAANERARFDALTHAAREDTLNAIVDFLESSPLAVNPATGECVSASAVSSDSVGLVPQEELLQQECHMQEVELECRVRAHEGWREVQRDVEQLHETWRHLHELAEDQRPLVEHVGTNVEVAADNVAAGRGYLASAERVRSGTYCGVGVIVGAACGGPLGALAGAKAGLAAAAAGSFLGYFGGSVLDRRRKRVLASDTDKPLDNTDNSTVIADNPSVRADSIDTEQTGPTDKKTQ